MQPHGSNFELPPSGTQPINRRAIFADSEHTDLNSSDPQVAAYHPDGNGHINAPHSGHERSPFPSKRAALQAFPDLASTQSSGRSPLRTLTMAPLGSHAQGESFWKAAMGFILFVVTVFKRRCEVLPLFSFQEMVFKVWGHLDLQDFWMLVISSIVYCRIYIQHSTCLDYIIMLLCIIGK